MTLVAASVPLALGACMSTDDAARSTSADAVIAVADPAAGIRPQSPAGFPDFEARLPSEPGPWQDMNSAPAPMHGGSN
ncbi:hypothetical protein [Defluviimonas salinarum]|uniref:Uncharacterized protein n=1 Tax=Defluviimonas salinarum TaxID=2992147 RepID=A0ABT3J643_9RHOB|nr:hypothetical protein [Defluviimonas salinarum]MCW3782859.1 hypothetical protein [Defluviimonas salinarum]